MAESKGCMLRGYLKSTTQFVMGCFSARSKLLLWFKTFLPLESQQTTSKEFQGNISQNLSL